MTEQDLLKTSRELKRLNPTGYLDAFLAQNLRHTGRQFSEFRNASVNIGSISTANGSALVRIGDTTVLCGIRAEVAEPDILKPKSGFIVPNIELPALASSQFRPGPPSDEAQILASRIRDILRSSSFIPLRSLCIEPGKAAWVLHIDVVCINYDGNALDAALLAVMAACRDTRLPETEWDADAGIAYAISENVKPLQIRNTILSASMGVLSQSTLIADPDSFEEGHCSTFLTIAINEEQQLKHIWQAGGLLPETGKLKICIQLAQQRCRALHALIIKS